MSRWFPYLVMAALGCLPFASCTCQRDLPEPPSKSAERASGFGAALPTARRPPERVASRMTPVKPTLPAAAATPTPGVAEIPADFPADVPIFHDAQVFAVQQLAQNAHNVLFHADAETPEIFDYYHETMKSKGWDIAQEYRSKAQSFLSFRKGQTITNMTVTTDPRTGKRIIAIMYYEEQKLPFPEF
jgi:hypothetical protein